LCLRVPDTPGHHPTPAVAERSVLQLDLEPPGRRRQRRSLTNGREQVPLDLSQRQLINQRGDSERIEADAVPLREQPGRMDLLQNVCGLPDGLQRVITDDQISVRLELPQL